MPVEGVLALLNGQRRDRREQTAKRLFIGDGEFRFDFELLW